MTKDQQIKELKKEILRLKKLDQQHIKAACNVLKKQKKSLAGDLKCLFDDVNFQINALTESQDVSWDVYDLDNWESMSDTLERIANTLKIKINKTGGEETNAVKYFTEKK